MVDPSRDLWGSADQVGAPLQQGSLDLHGIQARQRFLLFWVEASSGLEVVPQPRALQWALVDVELLVRTAGSETDNTTRQQQYGCGVHVPAICAHRRVRETAIEAA